MKYCIVTAASEKYMVSLLGLISSVRLNWSKTIRIRIHDLGLSDASRARLLSLPEVEISDVPEFCPHWRSYYAWKLWILYNAPAENFLWLDAGIFVRKSLDPVLNLVAARGAFFVPNYEDLAAEAPPAAVYSCGLTYAEVSGRSSISANIMGFNRNHESFAIVTKSYELGLIEENLKGLTPRHRWDQALLSCALYSLYPDYVFFDGQMFAAWRSPFQVNGQLCWGQRRAILAGDVAQFERRISARGGATPREPSKHTPLRRKLYNFAKSQAARVLKRRGHNGVR